MQSAQSSANNGFYSLRHIKDDLLSSIVVALVAIPLCLGIALASGVPLFSGIITGIIGGIVVGIVSQSQVSVSGPAAGMIAVVVTSISQLGSLEAFLFALVIAGCLQIVVGFLRIGFIADYIPANVVQGLLCAIGLLIIIKQVSFAFGYIPDSQFLQSLKESQEDLLPSISTLWNLRDNINWGAVLISFFSLLVLIYWPRIKFLNLKMIPAPIVVVFVAILINYFYSLFIPILYLSETHYLVNIPEISNLSELTSLLRFPDFSQWDNIEIYTIALCILAIASLETLLNLEAAEKIDKKKRYCSRNREMFAQGMGNIASGLVGGLPITSVIVRTSVNIESGARSKLSTIFHGIILLLVAALFPVWINYIPLAALATILIYTGYKLSNIKIFQSMYHLGFVQFFPFIVTVGAIIFTDLLNGILIGLGIAIFFILRSSSQRNFNLVKEKYPSGTILRLVLPEQVTFLNKSSFLRELHAIPEGSKLIIDGTNIDYIDHDIKESIKEFVEARAPRKKIAINVLGINGIRPAQKLTFATTTNHETQAILAPVDILNILKEGNKRFVLNTPIHRNFRHQVRETSTSQHPLAVILGCIDSRVPVELVFDVGIGDIFCARIAGNIADKDILGSLEYACKVAGAKVIVVMGHKQCGAIKAACDNVRLGHITGLLQKIVPAITAETLTNTNRTSENQEFVDHVTENNIQNVQSYIYNKSTVLRELILSGEVLLIGGIYNIKTGRVKFKEIFAQD
jgi:carbonic anhydrase